RRRHTSWPRDWSSDVCSSDLDLHVAVPALPRRELEAGQRLHLHVDGEQIEAGVRAFLGDVIEEIAADDALAHEAAVAVGEHRERSEERRVGKESRWGEAQRY